MTAKALMVLGTASDAGKSLTVGALCRILRQDGFDVAPFKAQNMALNSFATREGHEIGRAQAMQAEAARVDPHVDMNPILLKPTSDVGSQVVINGKVLGNFSGVDYYRLRPQLLEAVSSAYRRLAARYEVVVLEGAGSPVEMNLKDRDVVNMKMAEIADAACLLVTDIDRGGVFASLVGTYALLEPQERSRFFGFLVNKFRGDVSLFTPGISYLEERLSQRCLGVIPYLHEHGIDDEDSVSLERRAVRPPFDRKDCLCVCVVGLPYLSNFTDFTALENVPGVVVYYTRRPEEARAADVLILPGSKNTIPDLLWLRKNGWEPVIESHAAAGKPLMGICGGFQMLGREIRDPHHTESDIEFVAGLGLLDFTTVLESEKVTRQATARFAKPDCLGLGADNHADPLFSGYEIHLGETIFGNGTQALFELQRLGETQCHQDGAISTDGRVLGTYLHGLFDSAEGLDLLLNHWRKICGKAESSLIATDPLAERERRYDALADHFRSNLKMDVIYRALNEQR
ncbi:MAG: adenosylcobyric acid synthase [Blastocatellia bacterium]|jgi:adenosylcobyric acid synthase|nr:adenosylcobyric acid synthase [Blastocatellia bacterium]